MIEFGGEHDADEAKFAGGHQRHLDIQTICRDTLLFELRLRRTRGAFFDALEQANSRAVEEEIEDDLHRADELIFITCLEGFPNRTGNQNLLTLTG